MIDYLITNDILPILILSTIIYESIMIRSLIKRHYKIKSMFLRHMHEGTLLFSEATEVQSPYLISVFFGMYSYNITYKEFYKYAVTYLRVVPVSLFNIREKEKAYTKISFSKPHKGKMIFYFLDPQNNCISSYTVRAGSYCDEQFLKWADKMTRLNQPMLSGN